MRNAVIRTGRLVLAPLGDGDAAAIHALWTSPSVRRYLFDGEILSKDQTMAMVDASQRLHRHEGTGLWLVRLHGEVVGFAGYWYFRQPPTRELLYGVAGPACGRGIATEAATAILRYGFEALAFSRVIASTDAENRASIRVLEKLGLSFARREVIDGLDTVFYAASRERWHAPTRRAATRS